MTATTLTRAAIIDADPYEQSMRASLSMPSAYSISDYRESGGEETLAWSGTLMLNGRRIGFVSNDGRGGCNWVRLIDPSDHLDLLTEAQAHYPEDAFEVVDRFLNDLAMRAEFNRKRSVIFIHDGIEVSTGNFLMFPARFTFAQAQSRLTHPSSPFRPLRPLMWNRNTQSFVAALPV